MRMYNMTTLRNAMFGYLESNPGDELIKTLAKTEKLTIAEVVEALKGRGDVLEEFAMSCDTVHKICVRAECLISKAQKFGLAVKIMELRKIQFDVKSGRIGVEDCSKALDKSEEFISNYDKPVVAKYSQKYIAIQLKGKGVDDLVREINEGLETKQYISYDKIIKKLYECNLTDMVPLAKEAKRRNERTSYLRKLLSTNHTSREQITNLIINYMCGYFSDVDFDREFANIK